MPLIGNIDDLYRVSERLALASQRAVKDTATLAASGLQTHIRANCAAGIGPYGQPWLPRKDGEIAMQRPGQTVTVVAYGQSIEVQIEEVFQWHLLTRPVIPDGPLPLQWKGIIDESYVSTINKFLRP